MPSPLIFPPENKAFLNVTPHTQSSQDKEIHLQRSSWTQTPKYTMQNRMPDPILQFHLATTILQQVPRPELRSELGPTFLGYTAMGDLCLECWSSQVW